jgi:hypothetical protein
MSVVTPTHGHALGERIVHLGRRLRSLQHELVHAVAALPVRHVGDRWPLNLAEATPSRHLPVALAASTTANEEPDQIDRPPPNRTRAHDAPRARRHGRRADALVGLVTGGGAKVATEVIVHVRADGASLDDGTPITGALAERLVPRSATRAMIHDAESHPTDVSGKAERGAVRLTTRDGRRGRASEARRRSEQEPGDEGTGSRRATQAAPEP